MNEYSRQTLVVGLQESLKTTQFRGCIFKLSSTVGELIELDGGRRGFPYLDNARGRLNESVKDFSASILPWGVQTARVPEEEKGKLAWVDTVEQY